MLRDLIILCGVGCALFGCWQFYPPLAWIAGGGLVSAYGLVRVWQDERNKKGRSE